MNNPSGKPDLSKTIMGKRCVIEVLRHAADQMDVVLVSDRADREVEELARKVKVRIEHVRIDRLDELLGKGSHQGVAAVMRGVNEETLSDFVEAHAELPSGVVVLLDGVEDPHNLGAVFRTAECFGADAVIWSKNRGAPRTPTVAKVSVGASEIVTSVRPANIVDAMGKLKEAGYWMVGADGGAGSEPLDTFSFPSKVGIVLGAEGEGLHDLVKKRSDSLVRIPMMGRISSLNVSQAGAVLLHAFRMQHKGDSIKI
jgi:23S rRNA (guanosine2251-2'-O)-methyltransferase